MNFGYNKNYPDSTKFINNPNNTIKSSNHYTPHNNSFNQMKQSATITPNTIRNKSIYFFYEEVLKSSILDDIYRGSNQKGSIQLE